MAKEFKEYDKKYAAFKGILLHYELGDEKLGKAMRIAYVLPFTASQPWSAETVRLAVYFHRGAEDWQKFRVSLKGNNTHQKLWRLAYRLSNYIPTLPATDRMMEQCRIDNYIGALIRGGQLNTEGLVQR